MFSSRIDSLRQIAKERWNGKFLVAGVLVLAGLVLIASPFVIKTPDHATQPVVVPASEYAAELMSVTGMAFVGKPGRAEWNQVTVGVRLMEGDLLQTDDFGEASIRYRNGNTVSIQARTVFSVRSSGNGNMEISVPYEEGFPSAGTEPKVSAEDGTKSNGQHGMTAFEKESSLFIKLDRIVPFGRSLELIGKVEAGSRLTVNKESVDVAGDGSFKHFTNPFPAASRQVRLVMKVANLAGHTRVIAFTHDFGLQGEGN